MIKFPGLDDKDLDELLKAFNDINEKLSKQMQPKTSNKNEGKNNKPDIEAKAWINGKEVDIGNFNINDILNNMGFGEIKSMFSPFPQPKDLQEEQNDEENYIAFEKDVMLKNIKIIEGILKICNIKDTAKVFNSINFDYNQNDKILKDNKFENKKIFNLINAYHIDLSQIKNIKKFLNCINYALNKKQIIF